MVLRESTGKFEKESAEKWCIDKLYDIQNAPDLTHEISLGSAAARWFEEVGQYQAKPEGILNRVENLLKEINPDLLLSQITKNILNKYVTNSHILRSNATTNRYLCLLSAICTRAYDHWECHVPNFKILQFRLKEPKENIKYFKSMDDIKLIVHNAAPHLQPIIWTAIYTGMRMSRILELKWEQVNFENSQIVFMGKDGMNKSIPIVPHLKEILKEIPRNNDFVFTYRGNRIKGIWKGFKRAVERAGIPYQNFHTVRHTMATWLLRNSKNLKLVKEVLTHSSISTTLKYAHLMDDEKSEGLNNLFSNPSLV